MDNSTNVGDKDLNALKERTKKSLDSLIINEFPKRIVQMNQLIDTKLNVNKIKEIKTIVNIPIPDKPTAEIQTSVTTPISRTSLDRRVFLFPNGVNQSNSEICKLIECVKPLLLDFVKDMRLLRFAIQLMVPTVEDGNNIGVVIQSIAIKLIESSEKLALSRLKQFGKYHNSRGNVVSWIARYPHCQDYRHCLEEEDQKFYLILCLMIREMRDKYVSINDFVVKNLDKIKNPRPVRINSMY
ncbi:proteasome activator complex subunit 3-like [Oppia nitens]|uniref:proteasome activator complex subunit 3-like n=1 Tax=Oppia nitens TaxID=1686743 RepID=UPI0023DA42A6|nr:proteasome activator complex subunit 3-like [Oppia nitens]